MIKEYEKLLPFALEILENLAPDSAPRGKIIITNDPLRTETLFIEARKISMSPALARISIRISPDNSQGEIWLIRDDPYTVYRKCAVGQRPSAALIATAEI